MEEKNKLRGIGNCFEKRLKRHEGEDKAAFIVLYS